MTLLIITKFIPRMRGYRWIIVSDNCNKTGYLSQDTNLKNPRKGQLFRPFRYLSHGVSWLVSETAFWHAQHTSIFIIRSIHPPPYRPPFIPPTPLYPAVISLTRRLNRLNCEFKIGSCSQVSLDIYACSSRDSLPARITFSPIFYPFLDMARVTRQR